MILRVDEAGRIAFPKPLQERLGLQPDRELEVVELSEGMLLRPARRRPTMVRTDGLLVHQGAAPVGINWDRMIQAVRDARIRSVYEE